MLSGSSVTFAGKVQHIAAGLFFAAGLALFMLGLALSALVGLIVGLITAASTGFTTFAVGAVVSASILLASMWSARSVRKSGDQSARREVDKAIYEAAALRGGLVTAPEMGAILSMPIATIDQALTALAKQRPQEVSVDFSDQGAVVYRFERLVQVRPTAYSRPPTRVATPARHASSDADTLDAEFEMIEEPQRSTRK